MAAANKPAPQLVRAVETFHGPAGLTVVAGDIYNSDAAVVATYPHRFEPVTARTEP